MSVGFLSAIDVTKTEKLNNLTQCFKVGCLQFWLSTRKRTILSPFNFCMFITNILKFLMFFSAAEFNDNFITPKILLHWDCTVCVVSKWVHLCIHTYTYSIFLFQFNYKKFLKKYLLYTYSYFMCKQCDIHPIQSDGKCDFLSPPGASYDFPP